MADAADTRIDQAADDASGTAAPVGATSRSHRRRLVLAVGTAVAILSGLVGAVVLSYQGSVNRTTMLRASGIPSNVPTSIANVMGLSPVPARIAPDFTLIDQAGRTLSLASFRGRAVVLEFMDPHCVDICPLVSDEFVDAYHDLGPAASKAVFVAVNVNRYHSAVADVAAFSQEHLLNTIPSWHFFTGPLAQLATTWNAYDIQVRTSSTSGDVIHTSTVYFIDPQGQERYSAAPMADYTKAGSAYLPATTLTTFGKGIALVVRSLGG